MNNDASWRSRVFSALQNMADREFQICTWTGQGDDISSMQEVISQLFDDVLLKEFVTSLHSPQLVALYNRLDSLVQDAIDLGLPEKAPELVIDDPVWNRVRITADELFRAMISDLGER